MDSSAGHGPQASPPSHCRFHKFHHQNSAPHHHHHHHFHVSPQCPLHSHMLHLKTQFASSSYPQFQNPETLASVPYPTNPPDLQVSQPKETIFDSSLTMQNEKTSEMEEEEDDPVFVLTDEWREFFAKSEAKRRLAKKQARKKGKNRMEQ